MKDIWGLMWERLKIVASIVGDVEARTIATAFYFSILVPFGLLARLSGDPLRRQFPPNGIQWLERESVPDDLESAKQQG